MERGRGVKLDDLAKRLGVTKRTLRNWKTKAKRDCELRSGRPRYTRSDHIRALILVARELKRQGYPGSPAISSVLKDKVQLRLIRKYVSAIKERRRTKKLEFLRLNRISVQVQATNVIWTQDGTHLGRKKNKAIEAQLIKDRASKKIICAMTGEAANGKEVVRTLELLKISRELPLVWMTDNGAAYCNEDVKKFMDREKIIHVRSLPRTPQHNGAAEVMMREIKNDCMLGKKTVLLSANEGHARLTESVVKINKNRRRLSLGFKSSDEKDEELSMNVKRIDREVFYEQYQQELNASVDVQNVRQKRLREREIVMCLLEKHKMILRKRSGLEYGR